MRLNKIICFAACALSAILLSACSETRYAAHVVKQLPMPGEQTSEGNFKVGNPYNVFGRNYYPNETYNFTEQGVASWYGPTFHGKRTANGEVFDKNELTAAHKTLQMPSIIRVTNLNNGRSAILRVNDRGPFAHDRILDVSEKAASALGFKNHGTANIRLDVLADPSLQVAAAAKSGQDTRGYEVALNQNRPQIISSTPVLPHLKPEPITEVAISSYKPETVSSPTPVPKPLPVQREAIISHDIPVSQTASFQPVSYTASPSPIAQVSGKIYVQAGSFSQEHNALIYSNQLAAYGTSKVFMTQINNKPFFRVRLGPYNNREQATEILTALNQNGNNAVIVVD